MKNFLLGFLIISLIINSSCGSEDVTAASNVDINADATTLLSLVNGHRIEGANCGSIDKAPVTTLIWDDALAKAALDHSNDMQQNDYFSHTGQNGSDFSERAISAGFEGFPLGENIANGYNSEQAVITGWMESPGHCVNIMNGNATHVGVAKSNDGSYWTMVLGKKE